MNRKRIIACLTALLIGTGCLMAQVAGKEWRVKKITMNESSHRARTATARAPKGVRTTLKYEQIADMKSARNAHQTFATGNGFMVVGGYNEKLAATKAAELWQDGKWKTISLVGATDPNFSVTLGDGRVMVGGGRPSGAGDGHSNTTAIYDPSTQKFTKGPRMTVERSKCNAILIGDKVYVSGNWYGEDKVYDCYDGSSFQAVGFTEGRSMPYLFSDAKGRIYTLSGYDNNDELVANQTFDGKTSFPGTYYDFSEGRAYYYLYSSYVDDHLIVQPDEMRTTDYRIPSNNGYLMMSRNDAGDYKMAVLYPDKDNGDYLSSLTIPTKHPVNGNMITWRGGAYWNEARNEFYLIGESGTGNSMSVHIISAHFDGAIVDAWSMGTADGFSTYMNSAAWTLLSDGRLACSGGMNASTNLPMKEAFIFTPPKAGEVEDLNPNPDSNPVPTPSGAMNDSLFSNYGNWMNLTEGYPEHGGDNQKMEVQTDGDYIHVCWLDGVPTEDNYYRIWYRRSTDRGKTWEDARVLVLTRNEYLNANSNMMRAKDGRVHFVTYVNGSDQTYLRYILSDDNGATFQEPKIIGWMYQGRIANALTDCDGDMVVIAAKYDAGNGNEGPVMYFVSHDCFNNDLHEYIEDATVDDLYDLKVSNGRFASMSADITTNDGLQNGHVYISTFDGNAINTSQVAPKQSDGNCYGSPNVMMSGPDNSYNYHPQIAIVGNTIHVMYQGTPEGAEVPEDYHHTLYQKSEDFGNTWSEVYNLPASDGGHGTIAAKGDYVYILTTATGSRRVVYHSNDNGNSWSMQQQCSWTDDAGRWNPNRYYSLFIAPDDPSGKHAYYSGNRYFYVETKDGFNTISKNFVLGREAFKGTYYDNNLGLTVLADETGQEHWFMQYTLTDDYLGGKSTRDIAYRRPAEPAPSKEAALDISNAEVGIVNGGIEKRVVIPMSSSLQLVNDVTVETWVYVNERKEFQIACNNNYPHHTENVGSDQWFIDLRHTGNDKEGFTFFAGMRDVLISAKDIPEVELKGWYHVALTYSDNNLSLYINGKLMETQAVSGNFMNTSNPISLGPGGSSGNNAMIDNFAIYSRALTQSEIQDHIANAPDGSDKDCRVLLTFNHTLRDESQYHNDAVALLNLNFIDHDGITTAISEVRSGADNAVNRSCFDLQGRRVKNPAQPGVYIQNGRKHVVK